MTNTEKLQKSVFDSLDAINKACIETSKSWDENSAAIPVDLFKQIIIRAKWSERTPNKIAKSYISNYNKMLDLLSLSAVEAARSFSTTGINLDYIDKSIKLLKDSFIKGLKE